MNIFSMNSHINNKIIDLENSSYLSSDERILTVEDVSELLKVSERSIRDAINSKELIAHKRFGRWYLIYSDVLEFIKTGKGKD